MRKEAETGLHRVLRSGWCLLLISVLVVGPASQAAYADDHTRRHANLIRLDKVARPAMVGTVDSLAPIMINGRETQGSEVIWSGDLLELLTDTSARLTLEFSGVLVLSRGAIVRLSTTSTGLHDNEPRVLIASLIDGDMVVDLRQESEVYIEAGQSIITASGMASFRIRVENGVEVVDAVKGKVAIQSRPKRELKSAIADPVAPSLRQTSVQRGKSKTLVAKATAKIERRRTSQRMSYTSSSSLRAGQVDTVEEPDANRLLRFEVEPLNLGTVTPQSDKTDQNGEVRLSFTGGTAPSGTIRARIVNYNPAEETILEEQPLTINVIQPGFWKRHRNKILVAAAALVVIIIIIERPTSRPPLRQVSPPR